MEPRSWSLAYRLSGEVWFVNLDPTKGHEQSGRRPVLILSVDKLNHGPGGLVVVLPITSKDRRIPTHLRLDPPTGGVRATSYIKCEEVRCLSKERLGRLVGNVDSKVMADVQYAVCAILGF